MSRLTSSAPFAGRLYGTDPTPLWERTDAGLCHPDHPDRAGLREAASPRTDHGGSPEQVTDEQIRDLSALQSAFLAVEAKQRRAERETLHKEVQQRMSSYA